MRFSERPMFRIDDPRFIPQHMLERWPQLRELAGEKPAKPPKYHNTKTEVDGVMFDSLKEANRFQELRMLEKAGQIKDLRRQVRYELQEGFIGMYGKPVRPIYYIADADYWENGKHIVEDTKSPATRKIKSYRLKKKMFEKRYPDIEFREW